MPIKEALFWFGLTVFGTGLFFLVEPGNHMPLAILLTAIGFIAVCYSVYAHHWPTARRLPLWIGLLIITWAAIAYDFYGRNGAIVPVTAWLPGTVLIGGYLAMRGMLYVQKLRLDIDAYVMPRVVTAKQASDLRQFLSQCPAYSLTIKANPHDQEAIQYAGQISGALYNTAWNVTMNTNVNEPVSFNPGLSIVEQGTKLKPQYGPKDDPVTILGQAFRAAQIQVNGSGGGSSGEYKIFCVVGARPVVIGRPRQPLLSRFGAWIQRLGYLLHARRTSLPTI